MIPKIIHYIWIGKNPLPKEMQECLDSWKRYMPEYELKCWDDSTLGEFSNVFMNEALEEHKFAFASDVIRLYVIYKYGGIYMDTDVMVYKSFYCCPVKLFQTKQIRADTSHEVSALLVIFVLRKNI